MSDSAHNLEKQLQDLQSENENLKKDAENREWAQNKTNQAIKSLYKDLEKKNLQLKNLDQIKSDFVSIVSHELRTPLAISTEGISLILDEIVGPITEKQRDLLVTSKESLQRLNRIINDLLDVSKIEAGKTEMQFGLVNIVNLIGQVVKSYQGVAHKANVSLTAELPNEDFAVNIDKDKIIQVVTNLINNAVKFTPENGSVIVSVAKEDSDIICRVKDTGMGISKENIPKLFNKFQQFGRLDGPGTKGTGLGLSIVKSLVEAHKGEVFVSSELEKGTTFGFSIPTYNKAKKDFDNQFDILLKDAKYLKKPLSFILVYLQNFQEIRDEYGENVLSHVVNKLFSAISQGQTKVEDRIFLYNIHSIYSILPETNKMGALFIINRIKEILNKNRFQHQGKKIDVNIKIGLAMCPINGDKREVLVSSALDYIAREKSILVVDDDRQVFHLLNSRFKSKKYNFLSAENGKKAIEMIDESKPDLIILDIMMPEMDGYEFFGRLKQNSRYEDIPIIILTAKDVEQVKQESSDFGSLPVVSKVQGFDYLMKLVEKTI